MVFEVVDEEDESVVAMGDKCPKGLDTIKEHNIWKRFWLHGLVIAFVLYY